MYKDASLKIKITPENCYIVLLCLMWSYNPIALYIKAFISKLFLNSESISELFWGIIMFFLVFKSFGYIIKKIKVGEVILYLAITGLYLFTMLTTEYFLVRYWLMNNITLCLLRTLTMVFIGASIDKKHMKYLHFISQATVILMVVYFFTFARARGKNENMGDAYRVLVHVFLCIQYYFSYKKVSDLIVVIIGCAFIPLLGTRGPLVLLLAFFLISLWMNRKQFKKTVRFVISLLLICGGVTIYYFWWAIIYAMQGIIRSLGFNSRIFDYIIQSRYETRREELTDIIFKYIKANPYRGYGLCYDRNFRIYNPTFNYSHNFFYELFIEFGVIIGAIIIFLLAKHIIQALKNCNDDFMKKFLFLVFMSTGFMELMFSTTYLIEPMLFFMIGLCCAMKRGTYMSKTPSI